MMGMLAAYAVIVVLTAILVIHNVRIAVYEFQKHRYVLRLVSQMISLTIVGSMLITLSYYVLDRTLTAADTLRDETQQHRVPLSATKA